MKISISLAIASVATLLFASSGSFTQAAPVANPEATSVAAPEPTPVAAPEPTPEVAPEPTPEAAPEAAPGATAASGQTAVIINATDYCIFLPPKYGGDIAENEDRAVAFCTKANLPGAPNARVLPAGFIASSHYVVNSAKGYVQITGRIDRSKYGLSANDGGGQYDLRAPVGSKMTGYNAFVQLTEPDEEIFCIRACKTKSDCPVNKSTYGCRKVIGGDYS